MTTASTREEIRQAYSRDAERYDRIRLEDPRGYLLSEHDRAIFRDLLPAADGSPAVLEVGAGTGRFTAEALAQGHSVTATDVNDSMLERLKQRVSEGGWTDRCRIEQQDAFNLTYEDGSFDFVYSLHMVPRFLTVDDQVAAIASLARVVRPGGRLLLNYRNRRSPYTLGYRGPAITPGRVRETLAEAKMRIVTTRGKWILNRGLLNATPLPLGRLLASADRALLRFCPSGAWDVFVVAEKER